MPGRSGYTCSGRGFFTRRGNRVGVSELGQVSGVDSLVVGGFHWHGRVEAMDASFIQVRMRAGHGTVREFLLVLRAGVELGRGRLRVVLWGPDSFSPAPLCSVLASSLAESGLSSTRASHASAVLDESCSSSCWAPPASRRSGCSSLWFTGPGSVGPSRLQFVFAPSLGENLASSSRAPPAFSILIAPFLARSQSSSSGALLASSIMNAPSLELSLIHI